ncbi:MAG TPA: ROK family protein [Candidatus Eisenbacteria bacterium]|jgi:glucokinase|nr:ROK family protein [Candidatus Eisenbacteria bacterium]
MSKRLIIGVDAGGTKIRAGAVIKGGKILASTKIPTETPRGRSVVLKNIVTSIRQVWSKDARAIGIGIAGIVDHEKGIYRQGPNFPATFKNVPLATLLRKTFKVPVTVDNDVHCFTLAEAKFGAAKRFSTVVGLTLGTGIGGGIVIDGRLYRGRNNAAGEIGHMTIGFGSDAVCGCGRKGHFEAFGSGSAMAKLYRQRTGTASDPIAIEKAALKGDTAAKATARLMSGAIAEGLANVVHILNPDIIVVGGGLAAADLIWKPALAGARSRIIYPALRDTPIVRASLGADANVLGAALITDRL